MEKQLSFCVRLLVESAVLCLGCTTAALVQVPGSTGLRPQGAASVPFDGGASLLLAAGVGMGIRRLRRGRAAE